LVIGFARNQRSAWPGIGDRLRPESVIDLARNTQSDISGIEIGFGGKGFGLGPYSLVNAASLIEGAKPKDLLGGCGSY
jgi:hypothetical protein